MTLDIVISGRNLEVTDRIREYIDKKVSKLDRYLPGIEEARVDLAYIKSARSAADRQVAQIRIATPCPSMSKSRARFPGYASFLSSNRPRLYGTIGSTAGSWY